MGAKYCDVVDKKCPSCGRNLQYHYRTMKGHQLMCTHEVGYVQITEEEYQQLKVLEPFEDKLKRYNEGIRG